MDDPGTFSGDYAHTLRMSRVNIYLPDELAARAKAEDIKVSHVTQEALEAVLSERSLFAWTGLTTLLPSIEIDVTAAWAALHRP